MTLSAIAIKDGSGAIRSAIVALDPNGNLASAHMLVDESGAEKGNQANPLVVTAIGGISISGIVAATQSGPWSVGRTWSLTAAGDTVSAAQSGSWTVGISGTVAVTQSGTWSVGRTWSLTAAGDTVSAAQSGSWTVGISGTVAATQSGTWSVGRTWSLTAAGDTVSAAQSGSWTVSLAANTSVSVSSLPATAATAAKQDTGNASLATIAAGTPPLGQATSAASAPVVIASDQSAVKTKVQGVAITQAVITLTPNTSQTILPANGVRRFLAIININTGLATLNFGASAAVVGSGFPCAPAASAGQQGGGLVMDAVVSTDAIQAISAAGTVLCVLEGV